MIFIYIIATGAAKSISSEKALWSAIRAEGMTIRDIHDLPRISQHEIAIADVSIARLIKKRFEKAERQVKIISLLTSEEVLQQRLDGFPQEFISKKIDDSKLLAIQDADFCVPADDMDVAARLIVNIIRHQELCG